MNASPHPGQPGVAAERVIPPVSIQLLGRFAVALAGREQPEAVFGGRLARQLLRMLALSRGTLLSKDVAAEALWPTHRPADAAGNVEILVSRIRRALGDRSLIQTGSGGYILVGDDRCWVDVEAFLTAVTRGQAELPHNPGTALAAFRGALALWRGEPLPEDAYTDWAAEHRHHLGLAHLDALEGAAAAALAVGDIRSAVTGAQAAADAHPLRELAVVLLVRALAASGDRAAALARFDVFKDRLAEELGIDPSADALRLRQQVLCDEIPHVPSAPTPRVGVYGAAALSADASELLALLALMGRHTAASVLASAAGLDLRAAVHTLTQLHRLRLVDADSTGWAVTAEAIGDVLAEGDLSDRIRRHLLLADALRGNGADPAEVAAHLAASGDRGQAAAAFVEAARVRLNRLTDDEAARLARAGLMVAPPGHLRAVLWEIHGEACRRRGRLEDARVDLDRALAGSQLVGIVSRADVIALLATEWVCQVCGEAVAGAQAPTACPKCQAGQDQFVLQAPFPGS